MDLFEKIISLVQERSFLYDKSDPDYKVPEKRKYAFEDIANIISVKYSVSTTGDQVEKTWDKLKVQFKNKYDLRQRNLDQEQDEEEWLYFKKLLFLEDYICHRPVLSSLTNVNTEQRSQSIWQKTKNVIPSAEINESVRIPPVEPHAKKRNQQKQDLLNIFKEMNSTFKNSSESILKELTTTRDDSAELPDSLIDYYNIIFDILSSVPENRWMDCFSEMLQEITCYIKKND